MVTDLVYLLLGVMLVGMILAAIVLQSRMSQKKVEEEKLLLVEMEKKNTDLQNRRYELRRKIQAAEEKIIQLTERNGERVLWYPDRKYYLLGKLLPDELLVAPEGS